MVEKEESTINIFLTWIKISTLFGVDYSSIHINYVIKILISLLINSNAVDIVYSDSAEDREFLVKSSLYPIKEVWNVIDWSTSNLSKLSLYPISTVITV